MKPVYFAANKAEGCGHEHRSKEAAAQCLRRIDASRGKPRVYRIVSWTPFKTVPA
jgi:hypothetical protein